MRIQLKQRGEGFLQLFVSIRAAAWTEDRGGDEEGEREGRREGGKEGGREGGREGRREGVRVIEELGACTHTLGSASRPPFLSAVLPAYLPDAALAYWWSRPARVHSPVPPRP